MQALGGDFADMAGLFSLKLCIMVGWEDGGKTGGLEEKCRVLWTGTNACRGKWQDNPG